MKPDLSNEYFTKVVPSLDTIEIDSRYVDAKNIESDKIIINGKDLTEYINEAKIAPKDLINRAKIEEGDYYILWDNNGLPVEIKWPNPESIILPYRGNSAIKNITIDLSNWINYHYQALYNFCSFCDNLKSVKLILNENITSIDYFFQQSKKLELIECDFTHIERAAGAFGGTGFKKIDMSFPNLIQGTDMFNNCKKLEEVNFYAPKLNQSGLMFRGAPIKSFIGNLDSLTDFLGMFWDNPGTLTHFEAKLPSLITEDSYLPAFRFFKLDKSSVMGIVNTLKEDNQCTGQEEGANPVMTIGIDKTLATDAELLAFLGIESAVNNQQITVTNPLGTVWTLTLRWN